MPIDRLKEADRLLRLCVPSVERDVMRLILYVLEAPTIPIAPPVTEWTVESLETEIRVQTAVVRNVASPEGLAYLGNLVRAAEALGHATIEAQRIINEHASG